MTRVYRYGVLGEPSPLGPIRRELALRAKYWDALVAVEAQYRRRERTLLGGATRGGQPSGSRRPRSLGAAGPQRVAPGHVPGPTPPWLAR